MAMRARFMTCSHRFELNRFCDAVNMHVSKIQGKIYEYSF